MEFFVEKAVLDAGVKIRFAVVQGLDNTVESPLWREERKQMLAKLRERYRDIDVHADPILEGYHLLHDATGVKRRKNVPASINLIKQLEKNGNLAFINQVVDIYNIISLDTKLALGAHDMDCVDGNVILRFSNGTERYVPLGQTDPVPVNPHEYCYCDASNEVLCHLEVRQVNKTAVSEQTHNVFYIVQGNQATPAVLLQQTAQRIVDTTTRLCGGVGGVITPAVLG